MDKKEALKLVQKSGYELENLPEEFKKDKDIVLEAVKQNGRALEYAVGSLKKDKEIVLEAVKSSGRSFDYVDESLKKDKDIILEAVKQYHEDALKHIGVDLKKDKKFILELVKNNGQHLKFADKSLKKDKEIVDAAIEQDESAIQYADKSFKKDSKITQEIYMKTEPAGRVVFGKLDKDEEDLFYKNYSKKEEIDESLLDLVHSGRFEDHEGVINSGKDGEDGNEGIIVIEKNSSVEIPKKNNKYEEGVYLTLLRLSKGSIQFEFELKDKEEFDVKQFKEISVPIKLPKMIEHERYGHPDFNIIVDCLYKDEPIEEFQDAELVDREYEDQIIFFEVKDGKTKILYSSFNGVGKFL